VHTRTVIGRSLLVVCDLSKVPASQSKKALSGGVEWI
jgi:hypothetical protein